MLILSNVLLIFFSMILIISSLMVVTLQNSMYAVLYLVLCFVSASCIMILLECEFIAIVLIIVYVGAITILFLFTIMMIDNSSKKFLVINKNYKNYLPIGIIFGLVFVVGIFLIIINNYYFNPYNNSFLANYYINMYDKIDSLVETTVIGQVLYTSYVVQFLLVGNILLMSIIGAIVLIINRKNYYHRQVPFKQLSRNYKNAINMHS